MMVEPSGTATPPISVSLVASRVMLSRGVSRRSASSIACGIKDRSARTDSNWSGCASKRYRRFPVDLKVVSTPAGRSSRRKEKISSSLSRSPSSSA